MELRNLDRQNKITIENLQKELRDSKQLREKNKELVSKNENLKTENR